MDQKKLMALPHPIRFEAVLKGTVEQMIFEPLKIMDAMKPYLADKHSPTEWIINKISSVQKKAMDYFNLSGGNLGSFILMLARSRLRAHGDPIFQITPTLQSLLDETDIGNETPTRFFYPPFNFIYLVFSQPNSFLVFNKESGHHVCEGSYIATYDLPAHHDIFSIPERNQYLKLDPSKPVRLVELVVTGSPMGKNNALDDASTDFILFIQDEDESLQTLLDRHIDFFKSPQAYCRPGVQAFNPNETDNFKAIIFGLAKALLYLNLPDSIQEKQAERTDLEKRITQLGNKKAAKLKRKLENAYDKIRVGPVAFQIDSHITNTQTGSVKTHWRRGHFKRIRFGEGRSEVKISWIQPSLVNASGLTGNVTPKKYILR